MSTTRTAGRARFGIIGLGTMGSNLALNVADRFGTVAVWNLAGEVTQSFAAEHASKPIVPVQTLAELARALERPRRIMMMVTAGQAVDSVLASLAPELEPGDIVIDGGNSWFGDTQRRERELAARGLYFFGVGVSGGADGARNGPSLMPGGDAEAYRSLAPTFEAIAARTESGPCVTWVGTDGAGHFAKTVHNGIEYADMQLIAEAYDVLRRLAGLDADALAATFESWNAGPLESFLIEITGRILRVRDPRDGLPLVERVLDRAEQKGTGRWTVQVALDLGLAVPTIAAAVDARVLSAAGTERAELARAFAGLELPPAQELSVRAVHDALLAAKICAYAQGFDLLAAASREHGWGIRLREIARIWKAGCIIRARLLDAIMEAYAREPDLRGLFFDASFRSSLQRTHGALRQVTCAAQSAGVPVPALAACLGYLDARRTASLPQNLTQAQRDAFGAHTYRRSDDPEGPAVHTDWLAGPPS